ncbi:hypothetical protein [Cupriavidus basilensis]
MAKTLDFLAAWKSRLLAAFLMAAAGVALGGSAAWWLQGNRYERQLAELREQIAGEREAAARAEADQVTKYRGLERAAGEAIAAVVAHAKEREIVKKSLKLLLALSTCLALAGCPSPSVPVRPAPVAPPQIPALPADLVKRESNLLRRLQQLSTALPETATAASATPTPVSTPTTPSATR